MRCSYICGHSHASPLTRHYVSYLISTFAETMPEHIASTHECMFLRPIFSHVNVT